MTVVSYPKTAVLERSGVAQGRTPGGRSVVEINMNAESVPQLRPGVKEVMEKSMGESVLATARHRSGLHASERLESAREKVAHYLGCEISEVVFVSSGSEANTWALSGVRFPGGARADHILISPLEHVSIINAAHSLRERLGTKVTLLSLDGAGHVDIDSLKNSWPGGRVIVSVQRVNPETGHLQPIDEIGKFVRSQGGVFHTDFIAAEGWEKPGFSDRPIDLMTLSSSSIGGPSGISALCIRRGIRMVPLIYGGAQEDGRRGGTQPVFLAEGFAEAAHHAVLHSSREKKDLEDLDRLLVQRVRSDFAELIFVGGKSVRRPGIINLLLVGYDGQALLSLMDRDRVIIGTGSSCSAQSLKVSHVLSALGFSAREGQGSVVLSLGWWNQASDVDAWAHALSKAIRNLGGLGGAVRSASKG